MTDTKTDTKPPHVIHAASVPPRSKPSSYPEPFFSRMKGRHKRVLGDLFGLKTFGVNLTTLEPGAQSSILHRHTKQDEFVYIVSGVAALVTNEGEHRLSAGMCAGFAAGGVAHQLVNRTQEPVVYLEIGDRTPGDSATYPADDLVATQGPDGAWLYAHRNGAPY